MRIEQIMTTDVATAKADTPLKEVARIMAEHRVSGLPVISAEGHVLGVVSEADLLPRGEAPQPGLLARLLARRRPQDPPPHVAADVMTAPAVTVEPFWSIPGTAAIMSNHGVKRLPVIRRDQLVGIVSRGDIVRAIARDDDQVRLEALDLVKFHQQLWSDPLPVDVTVVDGETTLTGAVERRSMADMLPELVSRIPGVINVRSDLTWQDDDRPE